jgi:hypothetical protein
MRTLESADLSFGLAIFYFRHCAAFLPKPLGNWQGIDVEALPPGHLIAGLMLIARV